MLTGTHKSKHHKFYALVNRGYRYLLPHYTPERILRQGNDFICTNMQKTVTCSLHLMLYAFEVEDCSLCVQTYA